LKGLGLRKQDLPGAREDPSTWNDLRAMFTKIFKSKTRAEWEKIFDGTDACCTPIFLQSELEETGFDQRPIVTLRESPSYALAHGAEQEQDLAIRAAKGQGGGVKGQAWEEEGLRPSIEGEKTLNEWLGWKRGVHYEVANGGLVIPGNSSKL
jgi:alpha-methylacyl-CoA racemase